MSARALAVSAAVCASLLSTAVETASADHYHAWCRAGGSAWHGLVHGNYETDNAWHARVRDECGGYQKYCEGGSVGQGSKGYAIEYNGTCDKLVYGTSWAFQDQECWGWAWVFYDNRFDGHYHYAHNRCFQV